MSDNFNTILVFAYVIAQVHGALIFSEIAQGLCQQSAHFLVTAELSSRLARHQHSPVVPRSWFNWKSCGDRSCTPFTIIVEQSSLKSVRPQFPKKTRTLPQLSVIVELKGEPDCMGHELSTMLPIMCGSGAGKARIVTKFLQNYAAEAQAGVVKFLESKRRSLGLAFEPLWITNKIIVTGSDVATVKEMLKGHKDVQTVRLEQVFEIPRPQRKRRDSKRQVPIPPLYWGQIELNISAIHSAGVNGSGVVVGGIDSGVDYTHPALFDNYRSDYGWFDPYFGDPLPNDVQEHGTHTMGIIAARRPFGVAPGATWIACRSCMVNGCREGAVTRCLQWMLCPTRSNGTDPDCSKKPHVINASWGGREYLKNGQPDHSFEGIFHCWRQAGIIPVFAAGNSGPSCSSLDYPGISNQVLSVGMLSGFFGTLHVNDNSSRGPPGPYWNGTIKPDFIAPGDDIFSTWPDGGANWETGTSQAAPHVTGTIALMLQVNPTLSFDDVRAALIASTRPTQVVYPQACGGISEDVLPNNQVGYGSINSYKAVFGVWP